MKSIPGTNFQDHYNTAYCLLQLKVFGFVPELNFERVARVNPLCMSRSSLIQQSVSLNTRPPLDYLQAAATRVRGARLRVSGFGVLRRTELEPLFRTELEPLSYFLKERLQFPNPKHLPAGCCDAGAGREAEGVGVRGSPAPQRRDNRVEPPHPAPGVERGTPRPRNWSLSLVVYVP
jgi:hypothetical protein